jgi:putative protease
MYAGNFTNAEIEEAVAYAHARGVKVYVTVNTLVHDRELADAGEYLVWLYSIGVDAVLVQDLGLASLARKVVPALPLHASTQMTIHNADGVLASAEMGFSSVVLARELTMEEIEEIAGLTADHGVGLEVFAHGALCFSYSGQCLLSSVIGGRSGNRGMCAQPCRKPYTLVAGTTDEYGRPVSLKDIRQDGKYLLSPKDLCTYPRLERLADSPIVSLKIEGRMKSPEYVAIVTAAYRRALDAISEGRQPAGKSELDKLALAFNRGFTDGYLFSRRHSKVMGREQPDNRGLLIGIIESYRPGRGDALVRTTGAMIPVPGDGLYIRDPDRKGNGQGFCLNTTPVREGDRIVIPVPGRVRKGSEVFMTFSTALAAEAHRIMAGEYPDLRPKVPVDCDVTVDTGGFISIDGTVGRTGGRTILVRYRSDVAIMPARTQPLTKEKFEEHLRKTGGTPFVFRNVNINYDGTRFAPVSVLNRIRREFLDTVQDELVLSRRPDALSVRTAGEDLAAILQTDGNRQLGRDEVTPDLVVWTDSVEGVRSAVRTGCSRICFQADILNPDRKCSDVTGDQDAVLQIRSVIAICRDAGIPLVWALPRITRQAELARIQAILPGLHAEGLSACLADGMGAARAVRSCCPGIGIQGSPGLNVFNHISALVYSAYCKSIILSPELSGSEIQNLIRKTRAGGCGIEFGFVVEGNTEAVVSENCVFEPISQNTGIKPEKTGFTGIRDSTGRIFPVRIDGACRTHVFNADETCLINHLPDLLRAGVRSFVIDARGRTPDFVHEIVRIYKEALHISRQDKQSLNNLRQQVRRIAIGRITAGHFARGLKEK